MKRLWVALATLSATLAATGGAAANLSVGVNDDAGKNPAVAPWFYSTMQSVGLRINTLTLLWDETAPTEIAAAGAIDDAIAQAETSGVTVELDLYPLHSMAFTGGNGALRRAIRSRAATPSGFSSSPPGPRRS